MVPGFVETAARGGVDVETIVGNWQGGVCCAVGLLGRRLVVVFITEGPEAEKNQGGSLSISKKRCPFSGGGCQP